MEYTVIIPAAGSGKRMNLGFNKIFAEVEGQAIIVKTATIFDTARCKKIIIVHSKDDLQRLRRLFSESTIKTPVEFTQGGSERLFSVNKGLINVDTDYVLIHDGARPYLDEESLNRVVDSLDQFDASILAVPVKDTIKYVEDGVVKQTPQRSKLYKAQTPQAFKTVLIKDCYKKAIKEDYLFTDDASIVEHYGHSVRIVEGSYANIKITTKEDL